MNFYPFHPGDYMLRTGHLSVIEDLAYRRLLDLYYINELPLQGTPDAIARVIRMREHTGDVAVVLGEFFDLTDEGYRHHHCDGVINQYQAKAKQAVENGKRGGRPRKAESNPSVTRGRPFDSIWMAGSMQPTSPSVTARSLSSGCACRKPSATWTPWPGI
nr:YdaU family protein [uncultured Pseudomonas sp.]